MNIAKKYKQILPLSLSIIAFIILTLLALKGKINLHVDELMSYGLSNSTTGVTIYIENGKRYNKGDTPFEKYVMTDSERRFNYDYVWKNQSDDVHPPLYYILLHTICSCFPYRFSIYFAASINILFSILTIVYIYKMCLLLNGNSSMAAITSMFFSVSAGIIQANTFLRMYIMVMFMITWITYLHVQYLKKEELDKAYYFKLALITMAGALTHYYFIIYCVMMFLCFGIYLISKRRWKQLISMVIILFFAALHDVLIFPAMINHIFTGYRGEQTFANLLFFEDYFGKIKSFNHFINSELFGIPNVVLFVFIAGIIYRLIKRKADLKIAIIFLPCAAYFLVISKISVYTTDRYIYPIYALIIIFVFAQLYEIVKGITKRNIISLILLTSAGLCFCIFSYEDCRWTNSYKESASALEAADRYSDKDCYFIYTEDWRCQPSYYEVRKYNSITFLREGDLSSVGKDDDSFVVYINKNCDVDSILNYFLENCSEINKYEKISDFAYSEGYIFM